MSKNKNVNNKIVIKGAREHNLKNIDLELPRNKLIVFTGVSGSGKSSLVFDTIYAEGQRRYVETLSPYVRQFLERKSKPDVDYIYGITPAVAIEQKNTTRNPRSTVGTSTEIYDYLRLLFARIGKTHCFSCGKIVIKDTTTTVTNWLENQNEENKFLLGFPIVAHEGRTMEEEINLLRKKGYVRIFYQERLIELNEKFELPETKEGIIVILERFKIAKGKVRENLSESIEISFKEGEGRLAIINYDKLEIKHFTKFYVCCGIKYTEPEPRFFSFNNPFGACPVCQGFGRTIDYSMDLIVPNENLSIIEGAIAPWRTVRFSKFQRDLIRVASNRKISVTNPYKQLTEEQKKLIWDGFDGFVGIGKFFKILEKDNYKMHIRILLSKYRGYTTCSACKGSRLRRESLQVKINEKSIFDIVKLTIEKTNKFFMNIKLDKTDFEIGVRVLKEIQKRLLYLNNVGLGYLTLDRLSNTLSGGEMQRINLATALGSALIGTTYILDEPTIGLHPRDNEKLISIIRNLRDIGNTVLVVEHDKEMIKSADMIIDMGPGAGVEGGSIIAQQTYDKLLENENSLTGKYLSRKLKIDVPNKKHTQKTSLIKIIGAAENNLKNITLEIPMNKFVVLTGVSGSGKSTLLYDVIYGNILKAFGGNPPKIGKCEGIDGYRIFDWVEMVDQSPIGKTPRSNPISYVGGFEKIRELFAMTPQARARGFKPGYFSFNVPGGRCETCQGEGFVRIEMQFLADLYLECEDCKGTRYKKETRSITYKGKNIVNVLNMTVEEAIQYFKNDKKIMKYLIVLNDVGLGYIKLGQPANTLSGGEAQRIKLANHLIQEDKKKHILFLFDEPTTGLHFDDIKKLITCFNLLIQKGNSIIIIEHNMDIIKCADYIIDLGPEAGERGGKVVVAGTPKEVILNKNSHTGKYLSEYLR
ncbi:MAG: excinuclease ABC subunit UvrA [Ignavibacteriales bacterium]|nr:excinuclease ABC subunit UvrA [Ignavibacteriales bacterium]